MPTHPPTPLLRRLSSAVTTLALVVLLAVAGGLAAPAAHAAVHGPDPTDALLEASRGPYATAQVDVSSLLVSGFGGGTIYYPATTSEGTFGGVAIAPGYTADKSSLAWLAARLASHGFVVFNIDTLTRLDQPDSRGRQLLAALDYLTQRSSVRGRVDATRLGVMGHSMGGGGTLEAVDDRPSLRAAVPLTPWNLDKTWSGVRTPTLIIGADNDTVAPVASHAVPFYTSLPSSLDKAYLELNNATHFAPNTTNTTIGKYAVAWMKRFIDDDTRYDGFLCPGPDRGLTVEEYRSTCPF
ncbi:alpha/beta hydrolase family protein [Microbispora rosea]|uniref:alpha/beta hydrolase family protein n=1 Tax=Microbispora rosea TaxID=58117 RepID=UPI003D917BF0